MNQKLSGFVILLISILISGNLIAQEEAPSGKAIGIIYADYRQQLNGDGSFKGFEVTRAYLGYDYKIDSHLSARVILDIGDPMSNEDVSTKRYYYLRNAYISYKYGKLDLTMGISDGLGHTESKDIWNKRYLSRPFLLEYKYMHIADIGVTAVFQASPLISIEAQVMNGEGFTNIQNDNSLLYGAGMTVRPIEGLSFKLFADTYSREDARKNTLTSFAGYTNIRFSVGFEFNYKTDFDWTDTHNVFGYSAVASYNFTDNWQIFGRYDNSSSVIPDGETVPWNINEDGRLVIGGVQYKISSHLRFALNYQGWTPAAIEDSRWDYLQVNAEFKF